MTNDPKAVTLICWTAPDRWSEPLPLELPLFFGPRNQRFLTFLRPCRADQTETGQGDSTNA